MYRYALEELKRWKDSPSRKPLIIEGARQVGKTWLMQEFGRTEYENTVYINFDHNELMQQLFASDLDTRRILTGLELYSGQKIDPNHTLIIFDEVQEVPTALTSLKYFCENAPEYHIVSAGSMLGIALHTGTSFPVGKVDFLRLYPMSFTEFLRAAGQEAYAGLIDDADVSMISTFKEKLIQYLRQYYYTGGMPEVVNAFSERQDFQEVRRIQRQILDAYEQDFSKHAPADVVPRIRQVWNSIPSQLAKENRKFIYGVVRQGARAREYETAIMWLRDCGLIHQINRVTKPGIPLKAYEDPKAFKIYLLDVGLLGCMSGLTPETLLDGNRLFVEFKGALTEEYVLQQLLCDSRIRDHIYYYTNERNTSEIDFLLDAEGILLPLEVKAEENLRSRSLRAFREKYDIPLSVRTSMSDYRKEDWLLNIPLYMIPSLGGCVQSVRKP